jgi:hypothetical protein
VGAPGSHGSFRVKEPVHPRPRGAPTRSIAGSDDVIDIQAEDRISELSGGIANPLFNNGFSCFSALVTTFRTYPDPTHACGAWPVPPDGQALFSAGMVRPLAGFPGPRKGILGRAGDLLAAGGMPWRG